MKSFPGSRLAVLVFLVGAAAGPARGESARSGTRIRTAAFVCVAGVYNSELMAPYDVFQHSLYRDSTNYIEPFVVSPDGMERLYGPAHASRTARGLVWDWDLERVPRLVR